MQTYNRPKKILHRYLVIYYSRFGFNSLRVIYEAKDKIELLKYITQDKQSNPEYGMRKARVFNLGLAMGKSDLDKKVDFDKLPGK